MTRIKIHISNVKLPFYPPCEVKCRLQNRVSTAHPPLPASFLDYYYVRQPVKVVYLPYKACFLKFADLFHYGLVSSWGEHSLLLSDGGKEGDTFSLCTITNGSILGMSLWVQENTSRLLLRKAVSSWQTTGLVRVPILVVRSWFESSRNTSSSFSMSCVVIRCSSMLIAWRWSSISIMAT